MLNFISSIASLFTLKGRRANSYQPLFLKDSSPSQFQWSIRISIFQAQRNQQWILSSWGWAMNILGGSLELSVGRWFGTDINFQLFHAFWQWSCTSFWYNNACRIPVGPPSQIKWSTPKYDFVCKVGLRLWERGWVKVLDFRHLFLGFFMSSFYNLPLAICKLLMFSSLRQ